jgi:hypothetical protein
MNAIPNRRGLLLGALTAGAAASVAAISPITAADPPDPVFALLEAHKAAWARLLRIENQTDDYDTLEEAGRAVDVALNEITNPTDDCGRHAPLWSIWSGWTDIWITCRRCCDLRSCDRRCWRLCDARHCARSWVLLKVDCAHSSHGPLLRPAPRTLRGAFLCGQSKAASRAAFLPPTQRARRSFATRANP